MIQLKKIDLNLKRVVKRKKREAQWAKEDGTAKPSRLAALSSDVSAFSHSRAFKIYLLSVAACAALVVTLVVTVALVKRASLKSEMAKNATFNQFVGQSTEILKVSDLAIPDSFKGEDEDAPVRFREPLKQWSAETAAPFKIDSRALAEEILADENEKQIRAILNN